MQFKKLLNIENLKNKDFFDIKSFVMVFSIYSIISISCSDRVYNQAKKTKQLTQDLKLVKAQYISTRTILMHEAKESKLLEKAALFEFSLPIKPLQIIYIKNEN